MSSRAGASTDASGGGDALVRVGLAAQCVVVLDLLRCEGVVVYGDFVEYTAQPGAGVVTPGTRFEIRRSVHACSKTAWEACACGMADGSLATIR